MKLAFNVKAMPKFFVAIVSFRIELTKQMRFPFKKMSQFDPPFWDLSPDWRRLGEVVVCLTVEEAVGVASLLDSSPCWPSTPPSLPDELSSNWGMSAPTCCGQGYNLHQCVCVVFTLAPTLSLFVCLLIIYWSLFHFPEIKPWNS